jgi:hypothetical protein
MNTFFNFTAGLFHIKAVRFKAPVILSQAQRHELFENRLLRTIFGHNEELHNLYSSPITVRMIKSRNMRCVEQVARMGEIKVHTGLLSDNTKGREYLKALDINGRKILKRILKEESGRNELDS